MNARPVTDAGLAAHEADSVEAVAALHREHHAAASRVQRAIDRTTRALGRPAPAIALLGAFAVWASVGLTVARGHVERPIFGWLELTATLAAIALALLILVSQRRADELAERRAQLTLQLALLADRRSAKIIALLEELRRDEPDVADRVDAESEAMAKPVDAQAVSAAIDETSLT